MALDRIEGLLVVDKEDLEIIRQSRERAAAAWCEETTENHVMDVILAESFARILAPFIKSVNYWRGSSKGWEEFANQGDRNRNYYHNLVEQIGMMFGEVATVADDGSKQDSVLCAKVPELVENLIRENQNLKVANEALATWVKSQSSDAKSVLGMKYEEFLVNKEPTPYTGPAVTMGKEIVGFWNEEEIKLENSDCMRPEVYTGPLLELFCTHCDHSAKVPPPVPGGPQGNMCGVCGYSMMDLATSKLLREGRVKMEGVLDETRIEPKQETWRDRPPLF